jgi:hypothetical protein
MRHSAVRSIPAVARKRNSYPDACITPLPGK